MRFLDVEDLLRIIEVEDIAPVRDLGLLDSATARPRPPPSVSTPTRHCRKGPPLVPDLGEGRPRWRTHYVPALFPVPAGTGTLPHVRWGLCVAWLAGAGAALAAAATVAHALVSPAPEAGVAEAVVLGAPVLASAVAGLVIATRAPGNRVGGLLLVSACALALFAAALHVARPGAGDRSGRPAHLVGRPVGAQRVADVLRRADRAGVPVPRRAAGLAAVASGRGAVALAFGGFLALALFDPRPFYPPFDAVPKPLPVADVATVLTVGEFVLLAPLLVAIAAVVARYRRSSGLARAQLRWFAFAAILVPATFVTCMVEYLSTGAVGGATYLATSVTQVAVVAAVTVAVLRYRLFEIDTLISRTAGYAVLTGLLAAVYVAIALVGGVAVGTGSRWTTAAATLAVALAFRPLRARVQRVVDRRFDRDRFDGLRRAERFLGDVRAGRAEPEQVGRVLAEAVGDDRLELYFWLPDGALFDGPVFADAGGTEHRELPADGRERTPVRSGAQQLAVVLHAPSDRPALLREVLETLGLAVEIARLRVEVRRQLARVRDSRARIVAATHAERRRIERNLHDGAQQRLVSVGLTLRHVQHRLRPTGGAERRAARRRGGRGGRRDRRAARAGPRARPRRARPRPGHRARRPRGPGALPVHVDAAVERLPGDVEAAAYFLASEAVTNVVKHANATAVSLSAGRENGCLRIVVADDGVGGAGLRPGSGLAGLADRVDALGGRLDIDSAPGAGTRVTRGAAVRVIIAEDQVLLREGLARLFADAGHDVVGTAGDGAGLLAMAAALRPDLAVVDVRMPPTYTDEGIRAAAALRAEHPSVGVLVLSQHVETGGVVGLASAGGFGYLLKDRVLDVAEFLATAERVARGGSALDPQVVATLLAPGGGDALAALSEREREVLALVAEGLTNAGIARRSCSPAAPSRRTCATSSPSSTSPTATPATAACTPCSPTCGPRALSGGTEHPCVPRPHRSRAHPDVAGRGASYRSRCRQRFPERTARSSMFTPAQINSPARIAGIVCLVGGLVGAVLDVFWLVTGPAEVSLARNLGYVVFQVALLVGLAGLAMLGAVGSAWWGRVGLGVAILSYVVLIGGELIEPFDPATAMVIFDNVALPFGIGMVLAGVAVLRADRWSGWRRFVPLALGAYMFVVFLPVVIATGSDAGFFAAVTGSDLLFAALGLAVVREASVAAGTRDPARVA